MGASMMSWLLWKHGVTTFVRGKRRSRSRGVHYYCAGDVK